MELMEFFNKNVGTTPIYKGCPNDVCYCTGTCKEVIGERDNNTGKVIYYNKLNPCKFDIVKGIIDAKNQTEPVYKNCPNEICHCTGECKQVIGERNKITNEITYH